MQLRRSSRPPARSNEFPTRDSLGSSLGASRFGRDGEPGLPGLRQIRSARRYRGRVMVIDDSTVCRLILEARLIAAGLSTSHAEDPRRGLDEIERQASGPEPFDLAFIDCKMPFLDGFELAREVRRAAFLGSSGRPLLIVGCTAYVGPETRFRSADAGMDLLIEKPIAGRDLDLCLGFLEMAKPEPLSGLAANAGPDPLSPAG